MATSRITCPDCKSVLKPAKPVPDGKKVKCPKCGTLFTTPGLVEEEERPRPSKAPAPKKKAAIKKAAATKPAPKKPVEDEDDDDGGGVYATVEEREKTAEEAEQTNIEYAPDMSTKDLRGPAQAAVVQPSNYILLISGLNCLSDLLIICFMFWPMVFSEHILDHAKFLEVYYKDKGGKDSASKIKSIPKERKDIKDKEALEALEEAEASELMYRWIILGVYIFLLIYSGIICMGAVKMQNLESRGWGMASSIMTILPFSSSGLAGVVSGLCLFLFMMLLDDVKLAIMYASGIGTLMWILAIVVGVWSLRTLMSEEVIAGFEYVAE